MTTLYEGAFAKLNLTLDVLGKRPDGYHDLRGIMQTISLCDDLTIRLDTGKEWQIDCGNSKIPNDSRNLAWRAAESFFMATGIQPNGVSIHVVKRIPSEAGMGGGSADAAAVLRALNRHYAFPLSSQKLIFLAATVGSDVPFCVYGGTAIAEGRGERLTWLPDLPECSIVTCKPDFSVSTPVLFRRIDSYTLKDRPDHCAMEAAVRRQDLSGIGSLVCNVFDPLVDQEYPVIGDIKNAMLRSGALGAQMTGSGSAVYGLFDRSDYATDAVCRLSAILDRVWICTPVGKYT